MPSAATRASYAAVGATAGAAAVALAPTAVPAQPYVDFKVATSSKVFFITIDDGNQHQAALASYVKRTHVPVTVFLTNAALRHDVSYFKQVAAYGTVQNHTMTHPDLSLVSAAKRSYEICRASAIYATDFGARPTLLRPPYGGGWMPKRNSAAIISAAQACGIHHVVLWNVTMGPTGKMAFSGTYFHPGDIVLLHFEGNIAGNVARLVKLYASHGLHPASLADYLR
jgi:peptidoglycan/xylan/chitin deacetylase (PgdA/CDA1 family)